MNIFDLCLHKPAAALQAIKSDTKLLSARSTPSASTVLMTAAHNGSPALVRALIKLGADVNAVRPDGITATILAAQQGNAKALELLLAAGAEVDAKTKDGQTALSLALVFGRDACAERLIRAGADVTHRTKRGTLLEVITRTGSVALARAVVDRGSKKPPPALVAKARRSIPGARGTTIDLLDHAEARKLLASLGVWKHARRWFPGDFSDPALVYRSGLRLPRLRLDHSFPIDGKKGPAVGAGVIVMGDLVVDKTIENGEQDFGPFLVVTGNLIADNVAVAGADILVARDLRVRGAFHGYYNHGHTTVLGATTVGLMLADDYGITLGGKVKGTVVRTPGHVTSKHPLAKEPPLDTLLAKRFLERDDDEVRMKSDAIYTALVAGKSIAK